MEDAFLESKISEPGWVGEKFQAKNFETLSSDFHTANSSSSDERNLLCNVGLVGHHRQEYPINPKAQVTGLSDVKKPDSISGTDSKSNDDTLPSNGKLDQSQTGENVQDRNLKVLASHTDNIKINADHTSHKVINPIDHCKIHSTSASHTASMSDLHKINASSKTSFRIFDPKKSHTCIRSHNKSAGNWECKVSKSKEKFTNTPENTHMPLKEEENMTIKMEKPVQTFKDTIKLKPELVKPPDIQRKANASDEKRTGSGSDNNEMERMEKEQKKFDVKKGNGLKKDEVKEKTGAQLNNLKTVLTLETDKEERPKVEENVEEESNLKTDKSCSCFPSFSGILQKKREIKQNEKPINHKRIGTACKETTEHSTSGNMKQARRTDYQMKKFNSRHRRQIVESESDSDSVTEGTIRIKLSFKPSETDCTDNPKIKIKEDVNIENKTKFSEIKKQSNPIIVNIKEHRNISEVPKPEVLRQSSPPSSSERGKAGKERLPSCERGKTVKELSLSRDRKKITRERYLGHDRLKTMQGLQSKNEKVNSEEDQSLSESLAAKTTSNESSIRSRSDESSPTNTIENFKKRKVSELESTRSRILEANPLFKKQMSQNLLDDKEKA